MRARSGSGRRREGGGSRCRQARLGILHIVSLYSQQSLNPAAKALRMLDILVLDRFKLTIRVPDLADESHRRWCQRVIFRELELGRENTAFKWRALRPLDQRLPVQEVVFGDRPSCDAFGWVVGQGAIFLEEAAMRR